MRPFEPCPSRSVTGWSSSHCRPTRSIAEPTPSDLYYLSLEFLIGRSLRSNLVNLGLLNNCSEVLLELGVDFSDVEDYETDAALGNGGLGRLAACFLDSLATLGMPGFGYGINYEYGLFRQEIRNSQQVRNA